MPELHNKMELAREIPSTILRLAMTMLDRFILPNTFGLKHLETINATCRTTKKLTQLDVDNGKGPTWLFDLDYLTDSMNYHPISSENQANLHACQQEANQNAGIKELIDVGDSDKEDESAQDCFVLPIWPSYSSTITPALTTDDKIEGPREEEQVFMDELERLKRQEKEANKEAESLRKKFKHLVIKEGAARPSSTNIFSTVSTPAKASSTNRVNTVSLPVSTASSFEGLSLSDPTNPEEDDSEIPPLEDIYQNSTDEALEDESWVDAMQEELFASIEIQKVLGHSRFALITEAIGHRQEEGIDYDESYQMDVKSAFLYGKINEEVYVTHHQDRRGTIDKTLILKKDKLGYHTSSSLCDDIIFGSTKNSCYEFEALRKEYISDELPCQDKYVAKILKKIDFANVKTASTPIETQKPLVKDEEASDVDVHLYRSMIGSLIVLDSSRPRHYVCSLWLVLDSDYAEQILTGNPHRRLSNSCPVVSTTFVEQFWTSAKSKTINNVRHITAKVAGKSVSISEASIRSDLLFDDADGIDSLPNQAIFDAISAYGSIRKVTPLFATMLVQPTQDEGAPSERPSEAQPTPSPAPTSEVPNEPQTDSSPAQTSEVPIEHQPHLSPRPSPTTAIPDSVPETSGENLGGHSSSDKSLSGNEGDMTLQSVYDLCLSLCAQVSDQAKEIQLLKAQITKLKKQAKPVIKHHRAWLKSVSLKQRFPSKRFSKKHRVHKESVSKQGRKVAKGESSVQRDPLFDTIPEDTADHMETENAQDEGRTREMVDEDKEIDEIRLSTEDVLSTDKEVVSTDKEKVSTDRPIVSTDGSKISTDRQIEGTDEHIEGTDDPKSKEEEERNRIAEEKAANEALIRNFDDIKAMINGKIDFYAEKLQEQEKRAIYKKERAKFSS
ncbi:hypothetical protein Tco_0585606 [Tanacetum coccineum]